MIDWTTIIVSLAGLAYSILAVFLGVLWAENKANRAAIAGLSTKLAGEYHDKDAVRQMIIDLIAPMSQQLTRIETILQTLQGSNFHNRNPG